MGAWGTGTFDDDAALDWLDELVASNDALSFLRGSIDQPAGYLEYEACHAIACASEMILACNGSTRAELPEEAAAWLGANSGLQAQSLRSPAATALSRVLGEESELNELWSENEDDYPSWRSGLEELAARLSAV